MKPLNKGGFTCFKYNLSHLSAFCGKSYEKEFVLMKSTTSSR